MIAVLCWSMLFTISLLDGSPESADQSVAAAPVVPLHQLIDARPGPNSATHPGRCSDAEFLRRISLDITGMPPLAADARAFLSDPSSDKRTVLIDRLLRSPHHVRHLSLTLDVLLMERRSNTHVSQDEWLTWLTNSVRENKPWNVLVREILLADGDDPAARAAARFYLDRGCEANMIARDVGRMFFGRDLQCAQCHDSPLVSDFLQSDYQGLLAIAAPGYEVKKKHGDKEVSVYAERAGTDLGFESVFNRGTQHRTGARIPGTVMLPEPFFVPGEEYSVAPADAVRSVPRFSRRAMLAEISTNGSNRLFNVNIANRLWSLMMGRGLVHPPDMIHPDNPATDPLLLEELGERFAADGFDIRRFLRELALSDTYQRPFDPVDGNVLAGHELSTTERLNARHGELIDRRKLAVEQYEKATAEFNTAEAAWLPVGAEYDVARNACSEAKKKLDQASTANAEAESVLQGGTSVLNALQVATQSAGEAGELLPGDTELAAAVTNLNARIQQLTAEMPAKQTKFEEAKAALMAASDGFSASRVSLETAFDKLQPLAKSMQTAEQNVVETRAAMQLVQLQSASLAQELKVGQRANLLAVAREQAEVALQLIAAREADLVQAVQNVSRSSATVAEQTVTFEKLQTEVNTTAAAELNATAALQQQQAVQQKLTEIITSLNNVQALTSSDDSLTQSLRTLSLKRDARNIEIQQARDLLNDAVTRHQNSLQAVAVSEARLKESVSTEQQFRQTVAQIESELASARFDLGAKQAHCDELSTAVVADLADRFRLSNLKPLTPEQLCWTIFRVTTIYDRYAAVEIAELEKISPLTEEQKKDAALLHAREVDVEQRAFDKLKGNIATFVQFYGGGAGQPQGDFYASPDQALFTANGGAINSWVAPAGGNPTERIIQLTDPREAAEELYLGVLTRMPSEEEVAEVAELLTQRDDRNLAAQELVWGLINSAEFRFNH